MFSVNSSRICQRRTSGRVFGLVVVLLLQGGCTKQPIAVIYNSSELPIIVMLYQSGNKISEVEIGTGASEEVREWMLYDVRILSDEREYQYDAVDPGTDFIITSGFGPTFNRRVYLQFSGDGRVFAFKDPERFGQNPPSQPRGFPLIAI